MLTYRTAFIIPALAFLAASCSNHKNPSTHLSEQSNKASAANKTLELENTVKFPHVEGGFDLMAVDIQGKRLFISAEDNHSVEIVDFAAANFLKSLPGFNEPKWIVYRPETNRLYISTGLDAKVTVLDATTYKQVKSFSFKEKCNNLRFDTSTQQLFVGIGNSFGSIGIIDVTRDKIIAEIPLSAYPKQFELDSDNIYVNIPSKNLIEIVSRRAKKVVASWPITASADNVPMCFDHSHKRVMVACEPGKFLVYNITSGKPVSIINTGRKADGIYLDSKRSLIYISCGEGVIEVIRQQDADHYEEVGKIATVKGAGTSLFSPEADRFFLAAPRVDSNAAELRIYKPVS